MKLRKIIMDRGELDVAIRDYLWKNHKDLLSVESTVELDNFDDDGDEFLINIINHDSKLLTAMTKKPTEDLL